MMATSIPAQQHHSAGTPNASGGGGNSQSMAPPVGYFAYATHNLNRVDTEFAVRMAKLHRDLRRGTKMIEPSSAAEQNRMDRKDEAYVQNFVASRQSQDLVIKRPPRRPRPSRPLRMLKFHGPLEGYEFSWQDMDLRNPTVGTAGYYRLRYRDNNQHNMIPAHDNGFSAPRAEQATRHPQLLSMGTHDTDGLLRQGHTPPAMPPHLCHTQAISMGNPGTHEFAHHGYAPPITPESKPKQQPEKWLYAYDSERLPKSANSHVWTYESTGGCQLYRLGLTNLAPPPGQATGFAE